MTVILATEKVLSVTEIKEFVKIKKNQPLSDDFSTELKSLLIIDSVINKLNSKSLTMEEEKTLIGLKKDKLEIKKILSSKIHEYLDDYGFSNKDPIQEYEKEILIQMY